MPRHEPYEDLDPHNRERIVDVFQAWASAQEEQRRPLLEFLDGNTLTPMDLLVEAPPEREPLIHQPFDPRQALRRLTGPTEQRAWPRLLNLIAVGVMYGEEDIDELLEFFERRSVDAAGPAEAV